jgi:uncharacterized protein YlaI
MICAFCGKKLTLDEVGLSRKLINRAATEFFCLACLSARFKTDEKTLLDMIERYRAAGCSMFR